MAKVDVTIPIYNTPLPYLKAALESVIAQTFPDWRAVVVNNGSTEKNTVALESYLQGLPRDKILYIKTPNRGLPAARNTGIKATDSPYIALLDADDAWYPEKLALQLPILDQNPEIALVYADSEVIDTDGRVIRKSPPREFLASPDRHETLKRMLHGNFIWVLTAVFRRSCVEAVGYFDESFDSLEDKALWVVMLAKGYRFHHLSKTVGMYRVHSSNMSRNTEKLLRGRGRLIRKIDRMADTHPMLGEVNWKELRKEMVAHMFREAREGFMKERKLLKALKYSFPFNLFLTGG